MMTLLLETMRYEAPGIVSLELYGSDLPRWAPGAHIELALPNGMARSYSLLPPRAEAPGRYRIGVLNVPGGQGGSACVHHTLRVGQMVQISPPRNHFPCDLTAAQSVLLAGGIGITPLYAMAKALLAAGQEVKLIYCARSQAQAAFLGELQNLHGLELSCRFDDEHSGPPDLLALLRGYPRETRFYACGPAPMLLAFQSACAALGYSHVGLEYFAPPVAPASAAAPGSFNVVLQRSQKTFPVTADESILAKLLAEGVECEFSCREGLCGSCETTVLAGVPAHADFVLTESERASNRKMMICVSRSAGAELVLDL